jgi:hypothetical protein
MRSLRLIPLSALVLAACSSDSPTAPTADVKALVDQMTVNGIGSYSTSAFGASVAGLSPSAVSIPSAGSSSCSYSATSQFFECAPITSNGMTFTRSFQLLDASGHALSTMDATLVASLRTVSDIKGSVANSSSIGAMTVTIDRHEDATMSDLKAAVHVLNGTATQKLGLASATFTYSSDETSKTSNLQLGQPTATVHWPLGGSITTDRTMTVPGVSAAVASHDVISFDGTSVMTVTHTTAGITMTCKIDLAKPGSLPSCS